jgi:DNA-binding protein YbaB
MSLPPFGTVTGSDPYDVLAKQKLRFEALRERAEGAKAQLAENRSTVSSPDGAVTITVNAGGQLEQLRLGAKADGKTMGQLTEAIMKTYRSACADAAARTINIMSDLSGEDSVTVTSLKANLPAEVATEVEEIRREEGRNI